MCAQIPIRNDRPPKDSMRRVRPAGETDESRREAKRFYARSAWRGLRRSKLRANPFCETCIARNEYTPATEVHHKIDRRDDPSGALDEGNLQSLCKPCHSRITAGRMGRDRAE